MAGQPFRGLSMAITFSRLRRQSPVRQEMKQIRPLAGAAGGYIYGAGVPAVRPSTDYTARVIPHFDGMAIPLEDARIRWQR
jgi:starch phosphorylase